MDSLVDSNDNWYKQYLNIDQINREAVNILEDKNFELDKSALDYRSATIYYIISKVFNRYFEQVIQYQKIMYQDSN